MEYKGLLIVVENLARSRRFYEELLNQVVEVDFGENIGYESGLALLEKEMWKKFTQKDEQAIQFRNHSFESYFETEDFDAFLMQLQAYTPHIELVHEPVTYSWQQRVVRFYDPDNHVVEVGESMEYVIIRLLKQGKTVEETACITQHPMKMILECANRIKK